MSHALSLLDVIAKTHGVRAAALFGADKRVLERGFGERAEGLVEAAATARHILRETHPNVGMLALDYGTSSIILMTFDGSVLVIQTKEGADVRSVLRAVKLPETLERAAPVPDEMTSSCTPLDAMNLVSKASRAHLGGPVIRNYMKKAQAELTNRFGILKFFTVDLEGHVTRLEGPPLGDEVGPALGAWARAFLARAGVVAPELAETDLRHITRSIQRQLEPSGFFGNGPRGETSNV